MALPTALLVKGLAGVGIVAAGTTGIVLFLNNNSNKEINEKIKKLGIEDTTCYFTGKKTSVTCNLDANNLKKITFVKGGTEAKATAENISAELTIEKLGDDFKTDFPEQLRFTFKNTKDADLTLGSNGNTITLKPGVSYDFKIKDGTKLEKAWTQKSLAEKVGISCTSDTETQCAISADGLNFWTSDTDYLTQGKNSESNKKVTVTKETSSYFEGLKFTVSEDITVTSGSNSKQLSKTNKSYEIALKDHNGTKTWFLVEKATASSVPQESQ